MDDPRMNQSTYRGWIQSTNVGQSTDQSLDIAPPVNAWDLRRVAFKETSRLIFWPLFDCVHLYTVLQSRTESRQSQDIVLKLKLQPAPVGDRKHGFTLSWLGYSSAWALSRLLWFSTLGQHYVKASKSLYSHWAGCWYLGGWQSRCPLPY